MLPRDPKQRETGPLRIDGGALTAGVVPVDGLPPGVSRRRSPRVAVGTVFFLNGFVLASWVPHIPLVKTAHGLGDGALGGVLFAMALGAVMVLPAAGWLVSRGGSRRVTLLAAAALALALPLPVLAPSAALVAVALWLLGAANATLDVAMNAQGVAAEALLGRPVLSSLHGLFSLGGLVGAAVAMGMMAVGIAAAAHVLAVSLASLAVLVAMRGGLLPTPSSAHVTRARLRLAPAAAARARRSDVLCAAGGGRDGRLERRLPPR